MIAADRVGVDFGKSIVKSLSVASESGRKESREPSPSTVKEIRTPLVTEARVPVGGSPVTYSRLLFGPVLNGDTKSICIDADGTKL